MELDKIERTHSKKSMASYGFAKFIEEFLAMAFGAYGFFFYETEIGLNVWLVGFGFITFAVWNAVNDPIVGFLTDRPFKFTKKWGRRFPWILISGVPYIVSYILIFTPPKVDPVSGAWILFAWLVFTTCLFDTFGSFFIVNFVALFPDKFRSVKERRIASGVSTPVGIVGIALGSILPPLFITFGDLQSYIIQGGVVIITCLIALALGLPGLRDDQQCVDSYLTKCVEITQKDSFFKTLKRALRHKNFLALIFCYILYQFLTVSMTASIPYVVRFILRLPADAITLIMAGFLIGALASIYFWIWYANKTNNTRKTMIIAGFALVITTIPLLFIEDYLTIIIILILWGAALGGFWTILIPAFSDVIDESVVNTGKREEGLYNGIQTFFGRIAFILQALSFATIHTLTGFAEGSSEQTPLAVQGIHIHFALIPAIAMLIGIIVFWRVYDLKPAKVSIIKEKLKEIKL
jgi:GPH family glycoside/pentoside/hexuronide:cation symporter